VTCGPGPHVGDWVTASTRCASDGISWGTSGRALFEKGICPAISSYAFALSPTAAPFHLRVICASAALAFFCFSPPQSPWPRWFIPSVTRPRGDSARCAACSDGVRRRMPGGSGLALLPSVISPPGSLCSLSPIFLKDYGEATLTQNKIFNPIKPRTTAVIGHGITTRRAEQRKTSRCRRTCRAVPCSRRRPSRPRTVRPSAPYAAPPRYPHIQGGSAAYQTTRFATAAWRGREASGYSFAGGELGLA
jgi:hypothetical protein